MKVVSEGVVLRGWHQGLRGRKAKFTPLKVSYAEATAEGEGAEFGVDIIVPKSIGEEVREFLGIDRFSERDYMVDRNYLRKKGALKGYKG